MTRKLIVITLAAACALRSQGLEIGGRAGGGVFDVSSGVSAAVGEAGVEACVFCSVRFGLFGEYSHWFRGNGGNPFRSDRIDFADLGGAGLRLQTQHRLPFFFDAGLVAGRDRHENRSGGTMGGVVVGAGVRIPLHERWYIRPQFRAYGLSPHSLEGAGPHWAASGSVGIGYRF